MSDSFLHRQPIVVDGFPDDFQETLEDLIDCFTPFDNILGIMKIQYGFDRTNLDFFCKSVYQMDFKAAYGFLLNKSDMYMRKAITNLAKDGNTKALDIASEHFMKLGQDQAKANARITINAVVPVERKEEN